MYKSGSGFYAENRQGKHKVEAGTSDSILEYSN